MRILAFAVLCLLASSSMAAEVEKIEPCMSFEALVATAPPGMIYGISKPVTGQQGQTLIAAWNAMEPPTNFVGDAVQFAFLRSGQVGVAILLKGCVIDKSIVPPALFEKLMKPLKGDSV